MKIDLRDVPKRVMFDSSVLTRTRDTSVVEHSDICRALWLELHKQQHHILIPAVALAEYMEHPPHDRPKRSRSVEIANFDDEAAVILATQLPLRVFLKQVTEKGVTRSAIKYDSMIVASAVRHKVGVIFCMDHRLSNLAKAVSLKVMTPLDVVDQLLLLSVAKTTASGKP